MLQCFTFVGATGLTNCLSKLPTASPRSRPGGKGMHARKISFDGGASGDLQVMCELDLKWRQERPKWTERVPRATKWIQKQAKIDLGARGLTNCLSKLPAARFRFGPCRRGGCAKERFHFGEGPRRLVCRCFVEMGALKNCMLIFVSKWIKKGTQNDQYGVKREPKDNQSEPRNLQNILCRTGSNKYQYWYLRLINNGVFFDQES